MNSNNKEIVDLEVKKTVDLYQITKIFINYYQMISASRNYCQILPKKFNSFID